MNIKNSPAFNWVCLLAICTLLAACNNEAENKIPTQFAALKIDQVDIASSGWPRTIMTSKGAVTLKHPPKRIVSTSITMTGTLLALNAPLVGTGATIPNTNISDNDGFFTQWGEIAKQRGVKPLYQTEHNAEAVIQANPDLIFIAETGGDSALKLYEQLKDIAPTVVLNYGNKSWMELADVLGNFIGLERKAENLVEEFNHKIEQFKLVATLPPQPTTALVYYLDGSGANVWTPESAQGQLLSALGFSLAEIPDTVRGDLSMGKRNDIVIASGEKYPDAITGNTLLLFAAEPPQEALVKANTYLANTPPVLNDAIYAVGNDTFRLDYFSASNLIQRLTVLFGKIQK